MIAGVNKDIGGRSYAFRMSSRSMMALESLFDKSIVKIVETFQTDAENGDIRMGFLVRIVQECMNDGAGADEPEAQQVFDALGVSGAAELLGDVMTKAFPEAEAGNDQGPAKP